MICLQKRGGGALSELKPTALLYSLSTTWRDPEDWGDVSLRNVRIFLTTRPYNLEGYTIQDISWNRNILKTEKKMVKWK
jgi:hypothetical protein